MIRSLFVFSLFFILCLPSYGQENYYVTFQSLDGKTNKVGASVYPGQFVTDLPSTTSKKTAWFKTTLNTSVAANQLNQNVLKPVLGNPSNGDKIYLRFKIKERGRSIFEITLIDDKAHSFVINPSNAGYFYVLVKASTIQEAQQKVVYATFDDIIK